MGTVHCMWGCGVRSVGVFVPSLRLSPSLRFICVSLRVFACLCPSLRVFARLCPSLPVFACLCGI